MKIGNQVCTLEQAKRLKELGVYQESLFIHDEMPFEYDRSVIRLRKDATHDYTGNPAAFTVAELGVMLPKRLIAKWKHPDTTGLGGEWDSSCNCSLDYRFDGKRKVYHASYPLVASCAHPNEANARAGLLIKLLEGKLITAEEVNETIKL